MHVMHHSTGCNGTGSGYDNFFRGSKKENSNEYNLLEKVLLNDIKSGGCGEIDATGFLVSAADHGNATSQGLSTNATLGYGEGIIKYSTGTLKTVGGKNGCDSLTLVGTYEVSFSGSTRTTEIKDNAGNVLKTYTDHALRKLKSDPGVEVKEEVKEVKRNPTPII